MRSIKKIHTAIDASIDDFITYRAMPVPGLQHIDPFLFLNHHGPQKYPPYNHGLPFGPHPHRGFETLTFIYNGDLMHFDSGSGKSIIKAGGIQWMTAGRGLVHAEVSSEEFMKKGGNVELIQIWFNLPARMKMMEPAYKGLQKEEIPVAVTDNNRIRLQVVSGTWNNIRGAIESKTGISIVSMELDKESSYECMIPTENNILLYVVRGSIKVNGAEVSMHQLAEFDSNHEEVKIEAPEKSLILLGHGKPFNEPIAAQGPFVMNYPGEIKQAWLDYQQGKMGSLDY